MPLPLLKFPLLVQEQIIIGIDLQTIFRAAMALRAFRRSLKIINYKVDSIAWKISEEGEEEDRITIQREKECICFTTILFNANVEFFNPREVKSNGCHENLGTISVFLLNLFKSQNRIVNIYRNLENLPSFYLWKIPKFHKINIIPHEGLLVELTDMEVSLEGLKFLFEEVQSDFYRIEAKCPYFYKGKIKCDQLVVSRFVGWAGLQNILSSNCQIEEVILERKQRNNIVYSITDIVNKWLTGGNMVLKKLIVSDRIIVKEELEHFRIGLDEAPAVLRSFNPTRSVLSRRELQEQCNSMYCIGKCWDIQRADGRRATIHYHRWTNFYFHLYSWDDKMLRKDQ